MTKRYERITTFLILVTFLVALSVLFIFVTPEEIVSRVGVRNGYILAFLVAFFGGFSAIGSISFISLLITLVLGGMNPIYLGLLSGISLSLGDMLMFFIACKGRELIKGKWKRRINKIAKMFEEKIWLEKIIPIIAFIYIGLTPLPSDVMIASLAMIEYPKNRMRLIIILADVTFALMIATFATKGVMMFK